MRKNLSLLLNVTLLTAILFCSSCKKEKTSWESNITAPIIKAELSIGDILNSDDIVASSDSSLKLVFENDLVDIQVDDVFSIEDSTIEFGSSLQTLTLSNDSTEQSVSFGTIANAAGFGGIFLFLNGSMFTLPAMTGVAVNDIPIDYSAVFETITIETGTMEISITNGLPVDIVNVQLDLKNSPLAGGNVVASTSFPLIASGATVTNSVVLDGQTISSQLFAELASFNTLSSGVPVLIDSTNAVVAKIKILNIKPSSATAIWPDQNLIDTTKVFTIPNTNGVMLRNMIVKEGNIEMEVFSSLQDTMYVTYTVPNLTLNGNPFVATTVVPPALPGGTSSTVQKYSFAGYDFVFNGYGATGGTDTINAYLQNTKVRMQKTGVMKTISKSDTLYIKAKITDILPSKAWGYMGKDTINIGPAAIDFDQFKNYISGDLDLENVNLDINMANGIGAAAELKIIDLTGTNNKSGTSVSLSGAAVTSTHPVVTATEVSDVITVQNTKISLNAANSNSDKFVGNLPHNLTYQIQTILNAGVPVPSVATILSSPPNFLFDGYGLQSKLNIEIPLSIVSDSLVLGDTIPFNFTKDLADANDANFTLLVENGFGFDATVDLYLLDENNVTLEPLFVGGTIKRATVDASTGRSTQSTKSLIHFPVDQSKRTSLSKSKSIRVIITLHTFDANDANKAYHKIYSSDSFKVKLIGNTLYKVEL